jgi:predicted nucleic acid-binding protein
MVPLCINEPESSTMRRVFNVDPGLVVWWCTQIEGLSALSRLVRMGQFTAEEVAIARSRWLSLCASATEVRPVEDVRVQAARLLASYPLRGADALQLGAALVWARGHATGSEFISLDGRLCDAARQEGFTVMP